jgi:hypothetical protein
MHIYAREHLAASNAQTCLYNHVPCMLAAVSLLLAMLGAVRVRGGCWC